MSDTTLVTKACLLSSAISDVTMIFLIVSSVAGATFRPFLSVAMALILRLAITTVGAVPGPGADAGNAWDTDSVSRASFVFVVAASSNRFLAPRVIVSAV